MVEYNLIIKVHNHINFHDKTLILFYDLVDKYIIEYLQIHYVFDNNVNYQVNISLNDCHIFIFL